MREEWSYRDRALDKTDPTVDFWRAEGATGAQPELGLSVPISYQGRSSQHINLDGYAVSVEPSAQRAPKGRCPKAPGKEVETAIAVLCYARAYCPGAGASFLTTLS